MRAEVSQLVIKGVLPSSKCGVQTIKEWQEVLEKIKSPISDEEAKALASLFPPNDDDCFGLAWSLVHLVETAPHWPLQDALQDAGNPWIALLLHRVHAGANAGFPNRNPNH